MAANRLSTLRRAAADGACGLNEGQQLKRLTIFVSVSTFAYAAYRGYYALGGTRGMLGVPVSHSEWTRINAIAAALRLGTGVVPLVGLRRWEDRAVRVPLLAFAWLATVGCISHSLIGLVQRVASLSGHLTISYPFWLAIDRRAADLQALFFNEPWFLIEGLAWAALAWHGALQASRHRTLWICSAGFATTTAWVIGVLAAFGIVGRHIAG